MIEDLDEIKEYISQHGKDLRGTFVSLPDKWAITKFIHVPAARGRGTLDQLMSFEIERHIPFNLEDVVYDFQVVEEKHKTYKVMFTVVRKQKVDLVLDTLEKMALTPDLLTTSSFAIYNTIELSGVPSGGWRHIVGIADRSDVLGKKNETNVLLYTEKGFLVTAVIHGGSCRNIKSIYFDEDQSDVIINEVVQHINDLKSPLSIEKFDRLILSGNNSTIALKVDSLKDNMGVDITNIDELGGFSKTMKDTEYKGITSSVGACLIGLGMGTFKVDMLPHKRQHDTRKSAPVTTQIFAGVIVILIISIAVAEYVKTKKFLEDIDGTLKANEPEIAKIEEITSSINLLSAKRDLLQNLNDNAVAMDVLAELSRILPKDSWITNLNYKGINVIENKKEDAELVVSGFAVTSSALIPILEDSPFFEKVEFVGPIKKTKEKEGFKLKAQIINPVSEEKKKDK
jgi:Tfp pilus assembly protein PilN